MAHTQRILLGVVGAGHADRTLESVAEEVGRQAAKRGWVLVTGGLGGVMEAASRGAGESGGLVVGILPTSDRRAANKWVEIPIVTNMGHARRGDTSEAPQASFHRSEGPSHPPRLAWLRLVVNDQAPPLRAAVLLECHVVRGSPRVVQVNVDDAQTRAGPVSGRLADKSGW